MSIQFKRKAGFLINNKREATKRSWISPFRYEGIPVPDKRKWGDEAKNGYSYRNAISKIRCPSCLAKIWPEDIRHNKTDSGWVNGCINCHPEWGVAMRIKKDKLTE